MLCTVVFFLIVSRNTHKEKTTFMQICKFSFNCRNPQTCNYDQILKMRTWPIIGKKVELLLFKWNIMKIFHVDELRRRPRFSIVFLKYVSVKISTNLSAFPYQRLSWIILLGNTVRETCLKDRVFLVLDQRHFLVIFHRKVICFIKTLPNIKYTFL